MLTALNFRSNKGHVLFCYTPTGQPLSSVRANNTSGVWSFPGWKEQVCVCQMHRRVCHPSLLSVCVVQRTHPQHRVLQEWDRMARALKRKRDMPPCRPCVIWMSDKHHTRLHCEMTGKQTVHGVTSEDEILLCVAVFNLLWFYAGKQHVGLLCTGSEWLNVWWLVCHFAASLAVLISCVWESKLFVSLLVCVCVCQNKR